MDFPTSKYPELIPFVLSQILDNCVTGIILTDPYQEDNPIVYANRMFELITGYDQEEIIGRNCRFLQGEERDQEGLELLRDAIEKRESVSVPLRNFRKNGELFYNRLTIRPLFDPGGRLIYFLGIQHDVTNQLRAERELHRLNQLLAEPD
jgi:PAS domain S-box-containing protein